MTFIYRHPTIVVGGALLLVMVLIAILAPWLGTVDPTALAPAKRTREPSALYWFGTDMLGRDVYSRVIYGARDLAHRRLLGGGGRLGGRHVHRPGLRLRPRARHASSCGSWTD